MKKTLSLILVLGLISLSGFIKESVDYEQIAFNYFVSDILRSDFKDISSFEFKGATEESYSTLGKYKFCLKPEEKLSAIIAEMTKGFRRNGREIRYEHIKDLTILDFESKANGSKLLIYPSVHVADNYYVFMSFQKSREQLAKYVFELTPQGNISRSCNMD
jgi:hypothetical protein